MIENILQFLLAILHVDRNHDSAQFCYRQPCQRKFKTIWQHDGDFIPFMDMVLAKHIGETVGAFLNLRKAHAFTLKTQ